MYINKHSCTRILVLVDEQIWHRLGGAGMIDILYDSNGKVPDVVNIIDNVNLYLSDTLVQPQSEKIDITESEVDTEWKEEPQE